MSKNNRVKYPRTPHLPWSPGVSSDDLKHHSISAFNFKEGQVVITEKMDGENTTIYNNGIHARSIDSRHHPSRDWVKGMQAIVGYKIPDGWRVCGENLYAKHSIYYEKLPSYFLVFSIWNNDNECLSWKDTTEWCHKLNLQHVSVLYEGNFNEQWIKNELSINEKVCEGYVVRTAHSFSYSDFKKNVAKWVRPQHVQSDKHWMYQKVIPNKLNLKNENENG